MHIEKVLSVRNPGASYVEDLAGVQNQSVSVSDRFHLPGQSPGFRRLRERTETLSIGLVLSDGQRVWGDAVGVAFASEAGREGPLRWDKIESELSSVTSRLVGQSIRDYPSLWESLKPEITTQSRALHYGLSQALVSAVALKANLEPFEIWLAILRDDPKAVQVLPLQGSCGPHRIEGALKMISHQLAALPHGQIDSIPDQLGFKGEKLVEYFIWLRETLENWSVHSYQPQIYWDMHGALSTVFEGNLERISVYLRTLEKLVAPYPLCIESPLLGKTLDTHLEMTAQLRSRLKEADSKVEIALDEWMNSVSAIERAITANAADWIHIKTPNLGPLHESAHAIHVCKRGGVKCLLGGSCIETVRSTWATVHLGLAAQPNRLLAKPGLGVDEAVHICTSEMNRCLLATARVPSDR